MATWQSVVDAAKRAQSPPDDTSIALCRIPPEGLSELAVACQGMLSAWHNISVDVHAAGAAGAAEALGLMQLAVLLDRLDPVESSCDTTMLGVAHLLNAAPAGVLVQGLTGNGETVAALVRLHKRSKNLASPSSQLVVACLYACARACESHGRPPAEVLPPGSLRGVADVLISHIVFLAASSEGGSGSEGATGSAAPALLTQRGLCCVDRALRTLASITQGSIKGEEGERARREVAALCQAADVGGRALQLVSQEDIEAALPRPWLPEGAAKGESVGELYVKLMSAAVTYVAAVSGAFAAPNGRLVLTGEVLAAPRTWLLGRGRLAALAHPLSNLAAVVHHNALLGHVECPDIRGADASLRNLLLTLALPLCTSKRQEDIVELVEFAMRYFSAMHAAGYERVLQEVAGAEPVALSEGVTSSFAPLKAEPGSLYAQGEMQPFFSAIAGALLHGVRTIGGQLAAWGVQLVPAPLTPPSGADPSQHLFGLEVLFPPGIGAAAGIITAATTEAGLVGTGANPAAKSGKAGGGKAGKEGSGSGDGVSASVAELFIKDQLGPIVVMGDAVLYAVQKSQEGLMHGRAPLQYRKATVAPDGGPSTLGGGTSTEPHHHVSARRCANCGARPQEPGTKLKACQKCGVALYCSRDCQLQHWAIVHKLQCKQLAATQVVGQ